MRPLLSVQPVILIRRLTEKDPFHFGEMPRFFASLRSAQNDNVMDMPRPAISIVLAVLLSVAAAQSVAKPAPQPAIDPALAARYFQEAEAASRKDGGQLWGVPLYGPMLLVDPDTRQVVANQPDREGKLAAQGGVYVGKLPVELGAANTAVDWAGVHWTMVMWPLPELRQPRERLMQHECFHRIQSQVALPARDAANNHLDTLEGRIWLRMEWRALEHALWQEGEARRKCVEDALYFRRLRRAIFPAAANENALELNEGLAEYTGVRLSTASWSEFAMLADAKLRQAQDGNFVRSFAYTSGPAYGCLLDLKSSDWRKSVSARGDLGEVLAELYEVKLPAPERAEAVRRAAAYDGDEVIAIETERARVREERVAAAKKKFVEGPVLALPIGSQFGYTFDPNAVVAIDADMTVYQGDVQVSDAWGVLRASGGVMMVRRDGLIVGVRVPAPVDVNSRTLKGDGWTLELSKGWTTAPGGRPGDLALKMEGGGR